MSAAPSALPGVDGFTGIDTNVLLGCTRGATFDRRAAMQFGWQLLDRAERRG